MKNKLRKSMCAGLVLVQLLSSGAFAMSDYKNIYKIDYMDEILKYDTGDFAENNPKDDDVQKGEYEGYIRLLKNIGVYSESTAQKSEKDLLKFSDLYYAMSMVIYRDEEHSAQYGSAKFDQVVTMKDALGKMEDLLGYDKVRNEENFMATAADEKLLDGLSYSAEREITFGEFSRLLWNTLNAYGIEAKYGADGLAYIQREDTLLERQLEIYEIKGFVNAANGVNIYKNSAPRSGYIEIDRTLYKTEDETAAEYLGGRVLAYIREDSKGNKVVLHIESDKSNANITVDFKNIEAVGSRLEYTDEDGKFKKVDVSKISYVLYNGNAIHDFSVMQNYKNMDGYLTLSKSEKNSEYDTAVIMSYSYYVVYSVDAYDDKIYLKDGALFEGENYIEIPEDEYLICTSDGKAANYSEFLPGDCIRVVQNDEKTFTRIDRSKNLVTGSVQSMDSDNGTVTINSKEYRVSKTYQNRSENTKIQTNLFGVFYITSDGYIAGYKSGNEASYAFLRKIYESEEDNEIIFARIFTQEGVWADLQLKKKIELDGSSNISSTDAQKYIADNAMTGKLIRYKVNAKNEITFIDTLIDAPEESKDSERLVESYKGTVKQSWMGGKWFRNDPGYRILNDRPVFQIPKNLDKQEEYRAMTGANLTSDETDISITLYSANNIGLCSVGLISESSGGEVGAEAKTFYCEKMVVMWNEEESEESYRLDGKYIDNDARCLDYTLYLTQDKKDKLEETCDGKIGAGTLMRMSYDSDKYISDASIIFTGAKLPDDFYQSDSNYYQYICGTITVVDTENGYICVENSSKKSVLDPKMIICIDSENMKSRTISTAELRVGERIYAAKIAGGGRVCAIVR